MWPEILLLIICAVPFPQDRGKAIAFCYTNGLSKANSSQTAARVRSKTRNQEYKPDAHWKEWVQVVQQSSATRSRVQCSLPPSQGMLVNRAASFALKWCEQTRVWVCGLCYRGRSLFIYIQTQPARCVLGIWMSCHQAVTHSEQRVWSLCHHEVHGVDCGFEVVSC